MSLIATVEQDAEAALSAIQNFIDKDVWPYLKAFLTVFSPLEAKALLQDIIGAVPVANTSGIGAAASQVGSEILPQTKDNAETAIQQVLASPPALGQ